MSSSKQQNSNITQTENKLINISNEIYENLPCHSTAATAVGVASNANGSNHKHKQTPANGSKQLTMTNNLNNNKESLYATPLRKSDRHKNSGESKSRNSGEQQPPQTHHNHHHSQQQTTSGGGGGLLLNHHDTINSELEERRIRDFLKDTTQMHKKIELHKYDYDQSNFSYLARKEHFANLVHQNVITDAGTTATATQPHSSGTKLSSQQNHVGEDGDELDASTSTVDGKVASHDDCDINNTSLIELEVKCKENLEHLKTLNKKSTATGASLVTATNILNSPRHLNVPINVNLNREWLLKKIAMCLEQRSASALSAGSSMVQSKKPIPLPPSIGDGEHLPLETSFFPRSTSSHHYHHHHASGNAPPGATSHPSSSNVSSNLPQLGYLILGENGSGKTQLCKDILYGTTGTKGILNRRLLACYFINSHNPDCNNLSIFIRNIVLQILSHSSYINNDNQSNSINLDDILKQSNAVEPFGAVKTAESTKTSTCNLQESDQNLLKIGDDSDVIKDKELEEILLSELKLTEDPANSNTDEIKTSAPSSSQEAQKKNVVSRQKSEQLETKTSENQFAYRTHPPLHKAIEESGGSATKEVQSEKTSPNKKIISKIPVPIGCKISNVPNGSVSNNVLKAQESIEVDKIDAEVQDDGGEAIADLNIDDQLLKDDIVKEINSEEAANDVPPVLNPKPSPIVTATNIRIDDNKPPPLPKIKNCRSIIADMYYDMLISNPDLLESLQIDNIEKNPDDCFKKTILFPLLELNPPKNALLILIDSIDENYVNDDNLISTLKSKSTRDKNGLTGSHKFSSLAGTAAVAGTSSAAAAATQSVGIASTKSQNIAELLSNHIHLLPKWLFLVCTAKKQNKTVTKLFTGFKKLTLDDLRKSHVVKDVQQYIINRLNLDFRGINLTKDIIDSLNQLYIKSNGCLLYLYKVLNGIQASFFTFREIKLIPCTLNGLYLYICQKSFNKKQYSKIRPILNILLVCRHNYVDKEFIYNCLRTQNLTLSWNEFNDRLGLMQHIVKYNKHNNSLIKLFHNSFNDWLIDVKFCTKKFLCNLNDGHIMLSMYYMLITNTLCPNKMKLYAYHLIKTNDYLVKYKNINLDLVLMVNETSTTTFNNCLLTNLINCCSTCKKDFINDYNLLPRTKQMLTALLDNELNTNLTKFLIDFFKPNLSIDPKVTKFLNELDLNNRSFSNGNIDFGYNNEFGNESNNIMSSELESPDDNNKLEQHNYDTELAELLIASEKSCYIELNNKNDHHTEKLNQQEQNLLLQNVEIFDSELHKGKALIHILANEGNHILLERALRACKDHIDLEIEDLNGQTALNIASRNGHLEIVKLLVNFKQILKDGTGRMVGIDVNHADRDGWTPLRSASWGGHTEVVKLLIGYNGCSIDRADKEGRTALRAAAWSGNEDIVKILIHAGANVNSIDKQGRTSLIAASYMGHYDIVEILLSSGADVNHTDLDGRNALCVAALCGSSGYNRVISTLLEHGANTDQTDNEGMSPLLVSSFEGNVEICELLLENGADPDLADHMGRTPLWAGCTSGHSNVVKLLLFWGCGIDCMDSEGRTVLSVASAQGNLETVRQLLDRGLDETHRDNAGWTPLHYAAFEGKFFLFLCALQFIFNNRFFFSILGYADICVQLLESGAKIDECDNEGKAALHLAAQEGHNCVIEALLDIHTPCIDQRAHDGKTAFRLACLEGHFECIQTLLKYSADVNSKDADSRTTLYILALENKLKVVKFLLEYSNVDVNIPDSEGRTALHVSSWQGHVEMVKILITIGNANVNAMDLECRSPLHSCAWQGNHEVMQLLLYYGALADHACKQGATALGISAQEGHEQCVTNLLEFGANPFKSDHCGRTPFKLAAKSNRNNVLRILETYAKSMFDLTAIIV